jgi:hypothetical protein
MDLVPVDTPFAQIRNTVDGFGERKQKKIVINGHSDFHDGHWIT